MASAPKKSRTGDAPAVEQEAGTKEKPEVDGNPPIEEKPRIDVPPVRNPRRLPPKGRAWLQCFLGKERERMDELRDPDRFLVQPVRLLLVNRSFLHAFFDAELFGAAEIKLEREGAIRIRKFGRISIPFAKTSEEVATLLRLARELTAIRIACAIEASRATFRVMRQWMQVASEVHALLLLSSIKLKIDQGGYSFVQMLVDSLPDKVTCLLADDLGIATLFRKRTTLLESADFSEAGNERPYVVDAFRLKSRRIGFHSYDETQIPLFDCAPFDCNEHLQELHISGDVFRAPVYFSPEEDDCCPEEEDDLFSKNGVSHLFPLLRPINDHFKLICGQHPSVWLYDESRDMRQVEDIAADAIFYAKLLRGAGFQSNDIELWIECCDYKCWSYVSREQAFERLKWKREEDVWLPNDEEFVPACSLVHNGVRIVLLFAG